MATKNNKLRNRTQVNIFTIVNSRTDSTWSKMGTVTFDWFSSGYAVKYCEFGMYNSVYINIIFIPT